jgi:hypothetical protein
VPSTQVTPTEPKVAPPTATDASPREEPEEQGGQRRRLTVAVTCDRAAHEAVPRQMSANGEGLMSFEKLGPLVQVQFRVFSAAIQRTQNPIAAPPKSACQARSVSCAYETTYGPERTLCRPA